ncbi:hypothetical protein SHJG_p236 (plasmid) [Streptomyces hygroscopicus subsp. jinggangensis 5008]|nr:hypothetical protein SHJG_p236 [Streptomyces hygroscopicus subsp. jinggangensis 5008]AGF68505.1 hypothetical protein SHJGH_p236 [Streptomyces hygroscopicus subsp. jinggangensis TL01]
MADYPTMWNEPGTTPPAAGPTAQQTAPPPTEALVGRRTLADVTALLDNIEHALRSGYRLEEFHEGVRAAYLWAIGKAPSPITDRAAAGIPDARQLRAEDDAAEAAMRGPRRRYANGVQHAAMWLRGATDDQPWTVWET